MEGSAGVGIACMLRLAKEHPGVWEGCTVVNVCCGSNMSVEKLRKLLLLEAEGGKQ
jgi:hypothetical protein